MPMEFLENLHDSFTPTTHGVCFVSLKLLANLANITHFIATCYLLANNFLSMFDIVVCSSYNFLSNLKQSPKDFAD